MQILTAYQQIQTIRSTLNSTNETTEIDQTRPWESLETVDHQSIIK